MKKVIHKVVGGAVNEAEERRFLCAYRRSWCEAMETVRIETKAPKNESK